MSVYKLSRPSYSSPDVAAAPSFSSLPKGVLYRMASCPLASGLTKVKSLPTNRN